MEHAGVDKTTVGIVVPTGYSFNLDGTAIYLTMATLFIAEALGDPLSIGEQISLLVFMVIASKGAAGVTGAGLATLAGGLQSHRPELVDGVGLIVGIDRFMSEARALTNFAGNSVATVLIGHWTDGLDRERLDRVLAGELPFDERTMLDDDRPSRTPAAVPALGRRDARGTSRPAGRRRRRSRHRRRPLHDRPQVAAVEGAEDAVVRRAEAGGAEDVGHLGRREAHQQGALQAQRHPDGEPAGVDLHRRRVAHQRAEQRERVLDGAVEARRRRPAPGRPR